MNIQKNHEAGDGKLAAACHALAKRVAENIISMY